MAESIVGLGYGFTVIKCSDMKNRLLRCSLAALLIFIAAGCQKEEFGWQEDRFVEVMLNLSAAEVETRADQPMIPANENPIYDLWVLQFDTEGIIIGKPEYYPCDEAGELSTTLSPKLRAGQSTVCVVANLGSDFEFKVGGRDVDNVTTFRAMLIDAPLITEAGADQENIGHLKDRSMYMYGYFQGNITEKQSLNILLGRLFLRINLVLTNNTGAPLGDITIKIGNIPAKTRIPFVDEPLAGDDVFTNYRETIVLTGGLPEGTSTTHYYYMPENIRPAEERATEVTITANGRSASVKLGNDSPGVAENRDYSLNRNNIYKFNLNLR